MTPQPRPRLRVAAGFLLCGFLLSAALPARAQNLFVCLGGKAKLPAVITIAPPGHGWVHSAAAPVAGARWNRVKRTAGAEATDPSIAAGGPVGRPGIHDLDTAVALPLVDSEGAPTSARLTVRLKLADLATDKPRAEPAIMSKSSAAVPVGLMDASWRVYLPNNSLRLEIDGLEPGRTFDLYLYGAATDPTTNVNGENDGARFTLAPANVARGHSGTVETVGGYGASVFTYNPETDRMAPSPAGTTWARMPAVADAEGRVVFATSRNSNGRQFVNGFQLVAAKN